MNTPPPPIDSSADTGHVVPHQQRIKTPCPSCGLTTLDLDDAGNLICTWVKCANPTKLHRYCTTPSISRSLVAEYTGTSPHGQKFHSEIWLYPGQKLIIENSATSSDSRVSTDAAPEFIKQLQEAKNGNALLQAALHALSIPRRIGPTEKDKDQNDMLAQIHARFIETLTKNLLPKP